MTVCLGGSSLVWLPAASAKKETSLSRHRPRCRLISQAVSDVRMGGFRPAGCSCGVHLPSCRFVSDGWLTSEASAWGVWRYCSPISTFLSCSRRESALRTPEIGRCTTY
ncbi:uncharacterized protein BKA78DRAFT_315762 [Phyllosticta capitalensis]|uniref:uncharacterized protein n=1 Tax=Phyllosticta capitalensis TaxID=121624 RepID=UPI003130E7D1